MTPQEPRTPARSITPDLATTEPAAAVASPSSLLDRVDVPAASAGIAMTSGRRYEMHAEPGGDRLVVRGRRGEVLLRVLVTDSGPVLSFESAEIELSAARTLSISAEHVGIEARRSMSTHVGGDREERVLGDRRTHVAGEERVEAAAIQYQASERGVDVRAMGKIALDGDHVGLNDDSCPTPFPWTDISGVEAGSTEVKGS